MTDVLVIDNFDSFTFNLVDALACAGCTPVVRRNTVTLAEALELLSRMTSPRLVLSPGPGHPRDAGVCIPLLDAVSLTAPVLGICLGHQAIVEAFGGVVSHAPEVVHGRASALRHDGRGIFTGVPSPMRVARYHSLAAVQLHESMREIARLDDGTCMAVEHRERPIIGLQFHPESILTPAGGAVIENFVALGKEIV